MQLLRTLYLCCVLTAFVCGNFYAQTGQILRVNVNSPCTSGCDGTTWDLAYRDLQDALAIAEPRDEIWVAQGTYLPHPTDRDAYFQLPDSVSLFGGFQGGEGQRSERSWKTHLTVLSGNIGDPMVDWDNSYTIVYTEQADSMTIMDGFTIVGGKANMEKGSLMQRSGGGWFNTTAGSGVSSPTVRNCTFEGNWAKDDGGAWYNFSVGGICSPHFFNCTFKNNFAKLGGAIYNNGNSGTCQPTFLNCRFEGNEADHDAAAKGTGGVMYSFTQGNGWIDIEFTNCLFWDNLAYSGGALYWLGQSGAGGGTIENCTFYGNYANIGGAIYLNEGWSGDVDLMIANSIFWASGAGFDPLIHYSGNGTPSLHISYSLVDVEDCSHLLLGDGDVDCISDGMVFNLNPQFVNVGQGNFHLKDISPALNAGNDDLVHTYFDFDGDLRIQGGHVDLGIDERKRPPLPDVFVTLLYPEKRLGKGKQPIVYPNPAHETVFVDLGYEMTTPLHFDIFDALGQRVYQGALTAPAAISLAGAALHEGSYWLRLEGFDQVVPFVKI